MEITMNNIENQLTRKILDPIHGTIRLTALEIEFINHPLYQRLRNIKQNSFLYKVFPSAVHSRFEHSLGVLHLSNEILDNLRINAIRYEKKYGDGKIFNEINDIPSHNIQELRLAALLHDIGHGPMSHQFDSFMPFKSELIEKLGHEYHEILNLISDDKKVEHEHMSLIFSLVIFNDLKASGKIDNDIDIENVFKIIESKYGNKKILITIKSENIDILPLMTSIVSSCPIDADRMDYLLRDSYFSGVKCGIYDYNRLFMSIVPIKENGKIHLAYKESGIDSIAEFIGARTSLFSQVYYHKTNRAFSSMLNNLCENMGNNNNKNLILSEISHANDRTETIDGLKEFYEFCSDDYFLNEQVARWIDGNGTESINKKTLDDIIHRHPWSKIYEAKKSVHNAKIIEKDDKKFISNLKTNLSSFLKSHFNSNQYYVDIVSDVAFKDIDKTEVKLLVKTIGNTYEIKDLKECGDKLDQYQTIKYFIRIFIDRSLKDSFDTEIINKVDEIVSTECQKNEII